LSNYFVTLSNQGFPSPFFRLPILVAPLFLRAAHESRALLPLDVRDRATAPSPGLAAWSPKPCPVPGSFARVFCHSGKTRGVFSRFFAEKRSEKRLPTCGRWPKVALLGC